jgi:hypothetical protein
MIGISRDVEALLIERAAEVGINPEAFVRMLVSRPSLRGLAAPRTDMRTKAELIAGMEAIAAQSVSRPSLDKSTRDEIIGYDEFGIPR